MAGLTECWVPGNAILVLRQMRYQFIYHQKVSDYSQTTCLPLEISACGPQAKSGGSDRDPAQAGTAVGGTERLDLLAAFPALRCCEAQGNCPLFWWLCQHLPSSYLLSVSFYEESLNRVFQSDPMFPFLPAYSCTEICHFTRCLYL